MAIRVWTGLGADTNWSTAANWSANIQPVVGDDLVFPTGPVQTTANNDLAEGTRFNTVRIGGSGYNITGNNISLYGGLTANHSSGSSIFAAPITLVNAQTFVVANSAASLTLSGTVDTANLIGTTNLLGTATITSLGTSALTFDGSGTLIEAPTGVIAGDGSITKLGDGTVFLQGTNTFTGVVDIRQGIVKISNAAALGNTDGFTQVGSGASLQMQGSITVNEPLSIRDGGIGFGAGNSPTSMGALNSLAGTNVWSGGIELASTAAISVESGSLDIGGVISAPLSQVRNLIKLGGGTLQLSGTQANLFTGTTTVVAGTLQLNKSSGVNALPGSLVIGDIISSDNNATVQWLNHHQLPETDFFGTALVAVSVNPSGVIDLNGYTDAIGLLNMSTGPTFSADVMTGSTGQIILTGTVAVNGSAPAGSSGLSPAATITGNVDLGALYSGVGGATQARQFLVGDSQTPDIAADLIVSANITGGNIQLEKSGLGTIRLSGTNTYTGSTVLYGGFVELGNDSALGTGLLSIQGASNPGLIAVGGNVTLQNNVSLDGNVTLLGSNDLTFSGATTMTGNTNHIINVMNPNQQLVLAGGLKQWALGTSNLVKGGRGTLTLGGQNVTGQSTYQGTTTINPDGGTLRLMGSSGTLLNTPSITVGANATLWLDNSQSVVSDRLQDFTSLTVSGGAIKLTGNASDSVTESIGAVTVTSEFNATFTADSLQGATLIMNTLTLGNTGSTVNFVGSQAALSMTGSNRIIVANSPPAAVNGVYPQFTVTGPNSFDLATIGANSIGAAIVALPSTDYVTDLSQAGPLSNVRLTSDQNMTISRAINSLLIDPGVTLGGTGTLTVATGQIAFSSLNQTNVSSSIAGPNVVLGAPGRITVQAGNTASVSSQILAVGQNFYKLGGGTLVLRGDNTITGNMFLNEGVLNAQSSTALGSAAAAAAAITLTTRHNTSLELQQTDLGPITSNTKSLVIQGTGLNDSGALRSVAGNNTWLGPVTINGDIVDLTGTLAGLPQYTTPSTFINIEDGAQLNLFGIISGAPDLVKMGTGTLAYTGLQPNANTGTTRVVAGTLLLNKLQGLNAINTPLVIGIDSGSTPAEVRLANSDQILDTANVEVRSTGKLNLAGFSEMIANVNMSIGSSGAGIIDIGNGGWLTLNGNVTAFARGTGNATGAAILNGTLALQQYQTSTATTRTYNVNDGATGDDFLITSSIVDGSGLTTTNITKTGFGTLVYGGSGSNTYIGVTTVNQGELVLAKSGGTAFMGSLVIGDQVAIEGYAKSDVVRLRAPNQLPDALATLTIHNTGWLDMNGFSDTFGSADAVVAITLNAGVLTLNSSGSSGTLTLIGDITTTPVQSSSLFNVQTPPRIEGGSIGLGTVTHSITSADNVGLPYDLILSSNVSGSGGINKLGAGLLLLTGDNTYTGTTFFGAGGLAVGSNSALGTGLLYVVGGNNVIQAIEGYNGARTITNNAFFGAFTGTGSLVFVGGNQIGGGGNDLTFSGAVNLTGAVAFNVPFAGAVDFTGGVGELYASQALTKFGFGTLFVSSAYTPSGAIVVSQNSGTLSLRDAGTALNVGSMTVNVGGTFELDNNYGANNINRLIDNVSLTLAGGNFAFSAKPGAVSAETIGPLVLSASTSSMIQTLASTTPGSLSTLTFGTLTRNASSTIIIAGRGADIGGTAATNQVAYTVAPALTSSGVFQFGALYNSTGFEFMTASSGFLIPQTFLSSTAGASNTTNVKLTSNTNLSANTTMGGLLVSGNTTVNLGGFFLSPTAGPFLLSGTPTIASPGNLVLPADAVILTDPFIPTSASIGSAILGPTTNLTFGGRGTVALSGNNTFAAPLNINDGSVVVARSTTAIGATGANVNVNYGGRLELDIAAGGAMNTRTLAIAGQGEGNTGAIPLRVVSGDITWPGNVVMLTNRTGLREEAGSRLIINGVVSGAAGFNKLGPGTLQLGGGVSNTFTLQSNIWEGTVELNKTSSTSAFAAGAPIVVGDFLSGTSGTDSMVWLQGFQIANATTGNSLITMNGNALMDVRGFTEDFSQGANNSIVMNVGPSGSPVLRSSGAGVVILGAATIAQGNLSVAAIAGGTPSAASIQGLLRLADVTPTTARVISVTDTAALNDLVISAVIADSTAATTNLTFGAGTLGTGRTVLAADSPSFNGTITANAGELAVTASNALGVASAATVISGAGSLLLGGVTNAETILMTGTGTNNTGALRSIAGNNSLLGSIVLTNTATVGVQSGSELMLSGSVGGSFVMTKVLPGGLELNGTSTNTITGINLFEGSLRLNKSAGGTIMATTGATLTVGNDAGGAGADLLVSMAPNQFPAADTMIITSSGRWELNGNNESLGGVLNMTAGPMNSAQITSTTGAPTITFSGALNAGAIGGITTTSPGALLGSGISLNLGAATRNFTAVDSPLHLRELQIDANLVSTSVGALNKLGTGSVFVSQANPLYTGNTVLSAGTLAVGHDNALGTVAATLVATGAANLMPLGGPVSLGQAITLGNNLTIFGTDNLTLNGQITQSGARTIFFSQASSLVNLAGPIQLNSAILTVAPGGFNVVSQISGAIQDAGSGSVVKNGLGTLLLSSNSSNYTGATTINTGIVRISAANALGATTGTTTVAAGASLFVDPGIGGALTINESFSLTGPANGFQIPMGALRNASGDNTMAGTITLATATQNYVLGAETGTTMVITGSIAASVATANVVKAGGGTLELQGGAVNRISGSVTVREGTLRLNKSGSVGFGTTALIVGDDAGIDRLEIVGANQFTLSPAITMQSSGVIDASLATGTTNIGLLTMTRGLATSSTLLMGSVAALNLAGNVTLQQFGGSNNNSPAALIGGSTTGILHSTTSRVITVADSVAIGSAEDLTIAVPMTGVTPSKAGFGTLGLTAANSFTGAFAISQGFYTAGTTLFGGGVVLRGNGTLNSAASGSVNNVTISTGGSLIIDNSSTAIADRVNNTASITSSGGILGFIANSTFGGSEQVGPVVISGHADTTIRYVTAGAASDFNLQSLTRTNATATVKFVGVNNDIGVGGRNLTITTTPVTTGTGGVTPIVPFATIQGPSGFDLVADQSGSAGFQVGALPNVGSYDDPGTTPNGNLKFSNSIGANFSPTIAGDYTANAIIFDGSGLTAGDFGNNLAIAPASGPALIANQGTGNVIAADLTFATEAQMFIDSGDLTIQNINGGNLVTNKNGSGTLTIVGNSSLTGAYNINNGTVIPFTSSSLGGAGTVTIGFGASLELPGGISTPANKALAIYGNGLSNSSSGALRSSGTNVWGGTVTLSSPLTAINVQSGTLSLNGSVAGAAGLTLVKYGPGTLDYSGSLANTFAGTTAVNEGTLSLNRSLLAIAGPLVIGDNAGTDTVVYGPNTRAAIQTGAAIPTSAALSLNNGGVLNLNGRTEYFNTITLTGGSVGGGTINLLTSIVYNPGLQGRISGNIAAGINPTATRSISVLDGPFLNDLVIDATLVGSFPINKIGGFTNDSALLLSGDNVGYNGMVTVQAGTLVIGNDNALGNSSVAFGPTTTAVVVRSDGGPRSITNPIILASTANRLVLGGPNNLAANTINFGGNVYIPGATATATLQVDPTMNATISGSIVDFVNNVPSSLNKSGMGTLVLTGPNTYTGNTQVTQGVLRVTNSAALGGTRNEQQFVNPTAAAFTMTLNGSTTVSFNTTSPTIAQDIQNGLNSLATIGGVFGSVTVASSGTGYLVTFGGGLAGTDLPAMTSNNATFAQVYNGSNTQITGGAVLELAGVNLPNETLAAISSGSGYNNSTGRPESYTGIIRAVAGTTNSVGSGSTPIALFVAANNYFGVDSGASLIINGVVTGVTAPTGITVKTGTGTLELAGNAPNLSTGVTQVLDGALRLNKAAGLTAIAGATLTIGDNVGAANTDLLQLASSEQIADTTIVSLNATGRIVGDATYANRTTAEVQQIVNTATAGTYQLSFGGFTTPNLAFNSVPAAVQVALNTLPSIASIGGVLVSGAVGSNYTVAFLGTSDQPQLKVSSGTSGAFIGGTLISTTLVEGGLRGRETIGALNIGLGPVAAGSVLMDSGATLLLTANMAANNVGAQLTTSPGATVSVGTLALAQATNIASTGRTITVADTADGNDLTIAANVVDGLGVQVALIKAGVGRLTLQSNAAQPFSGQILDTAGTLNINSTAGLGAQGLNEVQTLTLGNMIGSASGGTFTLSMGAETTAPLAYNAGADEIRAALGAFTAIGGISNVNVLSTLATTNVVYTIVVSNRGNLPTMSVSPTTLSGGITAAIVSNFDGGNATSGVTVAAGAALELQGTINSATKPFTISGSGVLNSGGFFINNSANAIMGSGALRVLGGSHVIGGTVTLSAGPLNVAVESGSMNFAGLTNFGVASTNYTKTGTGTLELSGTVANTALAVNLYALDGTIILNKTNNVQSLPNTVALYVGDSIGNDDSDVVRYGTGSSGSVDQIGTGNIFVQSTGRLDMNGRSDSVGGAIVTSIGPQGAGDIVGVNSLLSLNGNISTVNQGGSIASSTSSMITTNLALVANRTITVTEGSANDELTITGGISGVGFGITKAGLGTLALANSNSFSGATNINLGTVIVQANAALGTAAGSTTVLSGATLAMRGNITYGVPEAISLGGAGSRAIGNASYSGAFVNLSGNNSFSGTITETASSTLYFSSGSLAVNGSIDASNLVMTLRGAGNLTFNNGSQLFGSNQLIKGVDSTDTGTVTFNTDTTYDGLVTLNAGTTLVNNNLTGLGTWNVNGSATLGGAGNLAEPINSTLGSGTLSPGNGSVTGVLSTGNVNLGTSASLAMHLNGTSAGTNYSQLNVNGTVNLNNTALNLTRGPFSYNAGTQLTLINNDGVDPIVGNFNNATEGQVITSSSGVRGTISYTSGSGLNDVGLTIIGPAIAGTTTTQTIDESQTVAPFASVTITDQQSLPDTVTTVSLDDSSKGVFTASSLSASGFTLASPGVYVFTGDAAAAQAAIRQLMFDPANDHVAAGSTETTTFTISVQAKQGALDLNAPAIDASTTVTSRSVNDIPTLDPISDPTPIYEGFGSQTIPLSGIGAGGAESQDLTVMVSSSNTAIIPTPTINYTSANSIGSLSYAPVPFTFGTSLITVTVSDNGGTVFGGVDTITRSFVVDVNVINKIPTIDSLTSPYIIAQDSPLQTVPFSGVSVGAGDTISQTILSVTATSSNTLLIGTPTVAYTASNPTGSLSFIPQAGQAGSALITLIVQDNGGTAGGGVDTVYRTFEVDVLTPSQINHAPTLDDVTPNPLSILEDSPQQTVNLAGIFDGDSGTQTITVNAVSSNPSIVPNPSVNYVNGSSTGSLSFTPVNDAFGSALITVTLQDNGGTAAGGLDTLTKSFVVSISNVNDPPVVTLTASALTYTEKDSPTPIDAGLQLNDIDSSLLASATVQIIGGFQTSEDLLSFTNQSGITGSYNSVSGIMTLLGAASPAAYRTALQSVSYSNSSNTPNTSPRIAQFVVDDGNGQFNLSTAVTRQINVVAVKDFPLITSSGTTLAYTEGDGAEFIDLGLTGAVVDSPSIASAIISVSNNFVTGEDVLGFVNTAQITGSYDSVQGILTLTGTTSYANYITALHNVTYTNTSNSPSTLPRTISFQIDDGNAINHQSNVVTNSISIALINSAPVVTTSGVASTYQKGFPPVAIDPGLTLNDIDTTSLVGATITIVGNYQLGADSLQFASSSGINTTGFDTVNGRLVLTGTATLSTYISALQSVLFFNNSISPSQLNRTITFQIDDGQSNPPGSNLSNVASQTMLISTINTAPDLAISTVTPLSYVEASGAIPVDSGIQVDDLDSPNLVGATITISSGYLSSEDSLVFVNQNGITGQFDSLNNILSLTGTASPADYQTALQSVSYLNNNNSPNTQNRVVSFQVNDGGNANNLSVVQSRAINVIAVNSPPALTGYTSPVTYTEEQPALTLAPAALVNDLDTNSLVGATISISPATYTSTGEDVLSFANQTFISGNFDIATGVLTLSGADSLVNYQTALRTIRYLNTSSAPHEIDRTITYTLDDGQAANNTSQFVQILKVVGVNDPPVITATPSTLSYTEGDGSVAIDTSIQAFDVDSNISSATVSISGQYRPAEDVLSYSGSVPGISANFNSTTGVLTLSGLAASSSYQLALRAVNYTNTSTDPDPVTRTISVRADDGQLANNLSNIATRAISVTNVNASPVLVPSISSGLYSENQVPQVIDGSLTLSDADNASLTGATVQITGNYSSTEDMLSFTNLGNGVTGSFNSTTGTLTLSGTASVANYQATLRTVAYSNTSEDPSTAQRSITMIVSDGQRTTPTSAPVQWQFSILRVNDAPVLNNSVIPSLDTVDTDAAGNAGNLVSELLARGFNGVTFTDVDRSDPRGIAVTNVDNSSGQWQYSLDGTNWQSFGSPSASAARLLASDSTTRVRFVPTGGVAGTFTNGLTYRAWDQSNAIANGATANASSVGGTTPYSTQTLSASVSVAPFVRQGTTLFVNGTGVDDTFSVTFTSSTVFAVTMIPGNVVANTVTRSYALPSVVRVIFSGNAGNDTITVTGNANSDSVTVLPGSLTFVGTGYRIDASSTENVNLIGGSNDVALLFGATSGIDTFTYAPTAASMIQSGVYSDTATGFGYVYGFNNGGASDVANLTGGTTGTDSLVSVPAYSILSGPGFFGQSIGFTHVTADSGNPANSATGPNNSDIAIIYGDTGSDTYNVQLNLATLTNSGFDYTVRNFGQVTAFSNGGSDVGTINGATTANSLVSGSNFALVTSTGYLARANDFRSVTINGGAGYDSAAMYDSSGNDTFVSNVTNSTLSGTGYSVRANSFELVVVIASLGTDVATLNGSSSNDTYFRQSNWASINSPGAAVQVFGFDQVTSNGNGGNDYAYIDDSLGSDFLFVSGSQAQLTIPGQVFTVNGFRNVFVRSINGGSDRQRIQAFDFALQMTGPWLNG